MKPIYAGLITFGAVALAEFMAFHPASYGEAGQMAGSAFVVALVIYLLEAGYFTDKAKTVEEGKP